MTGNNDRSDVICIRIHESDFNLEKQKIKEIAEGSKKMLALTDQSKKYTLIVFSNKKMIQLKPLIRNFKEYQISYDELIQNSSDIFHIPAPTEEISRDSKIIKTETTQFHIVEPSAPLIPIPPRKFLSEQVRNDLTKQYGEGKTDDQLNFLQQQDIFALNKKILFEQEILNKKILLEKELGIIDPTHSQSLDLLEDLMNTKRYLRKVIGEEDIDRLNFSEFEDLYGFFHELQDSQKSDDWICYKLTKLMKRRKELDCHKKFRELDEFLLKHPTS